MSNEDIGSQYDLISSWWHKRHNQSNYGISQIKRALSYSPNQGKALDVGCGAGGRFVQLMQDNNLVVTGLDASSEMVVLAKINHPKEKFIQTDIKNWDSDEKYSFILSWDCLFHLPYEHQERVLKKLCGVVEVGGVLAYTFGDGDGSHSDQWLEQTFEYSSIGINKNLEILIQNGMTILHCEFDQYPEKHVFVVAQKRAT